MTDPTPDPPRRAAAAAAGGRAAGGPLRLFADPLLLVVGSMAWVMLLDPAIGLSTAPTLSLLNGLPLFLFALSLWLWTRRLLLSGLVSTALVWLIFYANDRKLEFLNQALIPSDVLLLPQVIQNPDLFSAYARIDSSQLFWIAAASLGLLLLLLRFEPLAFRFRRHWQILSASLCTLLFVGLFANTSPLTQLYAPSRVAYNPATPNASAQESGLLAVQVQLAAELTARRPRADDAMVAQFREDFGAELEARAATPLPSPLPDIVIWLSEAFFDPRRLRSVEEAPQLEHFSALAEQGLSGELVVPAYGGATVRTEFELLTGYALINLPDHPYPYTSLVTRPTLSLPNLLREIGYQTIALHPYRRSFWNRHVAYPYLGFDVYQSIDSFADPARSGPFVSDDALVDAVLAALSEEEAHFVFAISIENHGPWYQRSNIEASRRNRIQVPPRMGRETSLELRNYLYHLENADRALGRLANALMARERPTVFLFFGDHLPALPRVYRALDFEDGGKPQQQTLPYLLLHNQRSLHGRLDTCTYFLAGLTLDAAGIHRGGYLSENSVVREQSGEDSLELRDWGSVCGLGEPLEELLAQLQYRDLSQVWTSPVAGRSK